MKKNFFIDFIFQAKANKNSEKKEVVDYTLLTSINLKDIIQKINPNRDLFLNHNNTSFLLCFAQKEGGKNYKIYIRIFDIMENNAIMVSIDPNSNNFLSNKNMMTQPNPSIIYEEKILEGKKMLLFFKSPKDLQIGELQFGEIRSTNGVKNIMQNNLDLINSINFKIHELDISDDFSLIDFQKHPGNLSEIIGELGYPHNTIFLINGCQYLIYYGLFSNEATQNACVIIVKTNKYSQIIGFYKFYTCLNLSTGELIVNKIEKSNEYN